MKSIVFDNAGTIIKRVTALKSMHNNHIIFETNTISMINENKLILVFQTPTYKLIQYDGLIINYLKEHPDSYEIAYSKNKFTKNQVLCALKEDSTSMFDIKDSALSLIKKYDIEICSGSAMIVDMSENRIDYVYTAGGVFFDDTLSTIQQLQKMNYSIYIASGDNKKSLFKIASILGIPERNVYDTCNVKCKEKVVTKLQKENAYVIMVGNNSNDYLAIKQADIGILSTQQGEIVPEKLISYADYVINNISDVLKIVRE